jgi:hypothetical protein
MSASMSAKVTIMATEIISALRNDGQVDCRKAKHMLDKASEDVFVESKLDLFSIVF